MMDESTRVGMPVWARVPAITILVLAGVVGGAVLAGVAGVGGGPGPDRHPIVQRQDPGNRPPPAHR